MRNPLRDDDRMPFSETLAAMRREARRRILPMTGLFVLIGLGALLTGWNWPRKYVAASTILLSEDKTIEKLMEGRAVATNIADRALIAREVIFSRGVMEDVLEAGGWLDGNPTAAEKEQLTAAIQARTVLGSPRENLIRIEYWDQDPQRAPLIAQRFADAFMSISREAQMRESSEAYDFIVDQVALYRDKLTAVEARLEAWRSAHPESRIEPVSVIESRISQLRRRIDVDQARLDDGARTDTAIRSSASASGSRADGEDGLSSRIDAMQRALDARLLEVTEAHPDAVLMRRQLAQLRRRQESSPRSAPALARSSARPAAGASGAAALSARIAATRREVDLELDRARRMSDPVAELAQIVRERDVARDLYQDLLRRQEYARLSASLDEQGRGLSFRTQEPATVPTQAVGLRFAHFALGGLTAAAAVPLGLLFLLVRVDPHLRSGAAVQRRTGIPVIATVPMYWNRGDQRLFVRDLRWALLAIGATVAALALASLWKLVLAS